MTTAAPPSEATSDELALALEAQEIAAALREGRPVSDARFDALYPKSHRRRSSVHWTPMEVALRASAMLAASPGGRILDVGSGSGKMCMIGALVSGAHWTGVEQDSAMVRVAARVARSLSIAERTSFVHADGLGLDWSPFGGIYLYNPFSEAALKTRPVDPSPRQAAFIHAVVAVEHKLAALQVGARVVTLHGFGGDLPPEFELAESVPMHKDELALWVRTH
ncbi:MAG: hypothetical protein IPQ07_03020 [Myxococcales bacterium]|nr:hypothetical protein [Myxococcales bacterium]